MGKYNYRLLVGLATLTALFLGLLAIPRFAGLYYLYLGRGSFESLFYEGFGLGQSASSVLSAISVFSYTIAIIAFAGWTIHLFRKFDMIQLIKGLIAFLFVFSLAPVAHVIYDPLGKMVCFNQKDGTPLKWYVIRVGKVLIYDSPGFDPVDGAKKLPVTSEICQIFEQQNANVVPKQIGFERALELFPYVWYFRRGDEIVVFDSVGLRPDTDQLLIRIDNSIVAELKARIENQRQIAAAAEARRQTEIAAERQSQADIEAKKRQQAEIEAETLRKEQEREAEKARIEALRLLREQAERDRLQAEKAARDRAEKARLEFERRRAFEIVTPSRPLASLHSSPPLSGSGTSRRIANYEKDTDHPSGDVSIDLGQLITIRVSAGTASVMMRDGRLQLMHANSELTSRDVISIAPHYPGIAVFSVEYR